MKTPIHIFRSLMGLCLVVVLLVGCGGGASNNTNNNTIMATTNRMTVATTYSSIPVGVVTQYSASLMSTWTSSNTTVAVIDANGVALGLAPGTTTITATTIPSAGSAQSVQATLTVTSASLVSIAVTPANYAFTAAASTKQFIATGTYSDNNQYGVTGQVEWTSSDNTLATVSATGIVQDLAPGAPTITATWPNTSISGSTQITTL